jgi:hypothetical protein
LEEDIIGAVGGRERKEREERTSSRVGEESRPSSFMEWRERRERRRRLHGWGKSPTLLPSWSGEREERKEEIL